MDNAPAPNFPWIGEAIAAVTVFIGVVGAWITDRLGVNNRIAQVEKEVASLSSKLDLLISLQLKDKSSD